MQTESYARNGIGAATAWAVILLVGRRRLPQPARRDLEITCGGWWMGWTAASFARIGAAPPAPLTAAGEKRLQQVSTVLAGLGLINAGRFLWRRGA